MRKRCSIQAGKKDNCWSEQSPKTPDYSVFGGPPTNDKLMVNPENDSPWEITHKIKSFQPNFMILVLL